jgi:hypothetical protein
LWRVFLFFFQVFEPLARSAHRALARATARFWPSFKTLLTLFDTTAIYTVFTIDLNDKANDQYNMLLCALELQLKRSLGDDPPADYLGDSTRQR